MTQLGIANRWQAKTYTSTNMHTLIFTLVIAVRKRRGNFMLIYVTVFHTLPVVHYQIITSFVCRIYSVYNIYFTNLSRVHGNDYVYQYKNFKKWKRNTHSQTYTQK